MFRYVLSPRRFLWGQHVYLGEVDWRLLRVRLLIPCFFVAQVVDGRSKIQTDQAKALWHIEPQVPRRQSLNSLLFGSQKKKDCVEPGLDSDFLSC